MELWKKRIFYFKRTMKKKKKSYAWAWLWACLLFTLFYSPPFYLTTMISVFVTTKEIFSISPWPRFGIAFIFAMYYFCSILKCTYFFLPLFAEEKKWNLFDEQYNRINTNKRLLVVQKFFCKVKNAMKNSVYC